MVKLRLIDGTTFYIPRDHARLFRSLHPHQDHSEAPWEKIVAISQPQMRIVADCLLYGVVPELSSSQEVLLSRIAATYGLPMLGAALGSSCDEKVESPRRQSSDRSFPASSWMMEKLRAQGLGAETKRVLNGRYSVKLPVCHNISVRVPRDQLRFSRGPTGWRATPEVWIDSLQMTHGDEAQKMRDLVREAQDIACEHDWRHTITIRLNETSAGRLTRWVRWPQREDAVFQISAATADFETRTAHTKQRRRLLTWRG